MGLSGQGCIGSDGFAASDVSHPTMVFMSGFSVGFSPVLTSFGPLRPHANRPQATNPESHRHRGNARYIG